jgi:hypothetical protein
MSFASDLYPVLACARAIAGDLDMRPYRVFIVTRSSSGTYAGSGAITNSEIEVTENGQPPRVRFASDEQIALGRLESGDATIGPITPTAAAGGTDLSALAPDVVAQQSLYIRLLGPDGASTYYQISSVNIENAFRYTITAKAVADVE